MPHDTKTLATQLAQHRPAADSEGFPPWLRTHVAAHVRARASAGTTFAAMSRELGVSITTLKRWTRIEPATAPGGFTQVVVSQPTAQPTAHRTDVTRNEYAPDVYLRSPQGFSLHGLTMAQALKAFASLQ